MSNTTEFTKTDAERQAASTEISKLVNEAKKLIRKAEKLATENRVDFSFSIAYGMGGYFDGGEDYDPEDYDEDYVHETGWRASSQSC